MNSKIPPHKVPGHFRKLRKLVHKLDPVLDNYKDSAHIPLAFHDAAGKNSDQATLDAIRRAN